jgi:hypothetical protein
MEDSLRSIALAACRAALKPLVRMLLKHGVMHREFVELSKQVYVETARDETDPRRPTNVGMALTGMDRRVTREDGLSDKRRFASDPQHGQDRVTRVLSGWHQDRDFIGAGNKPLALPLEGPAPSFAALVKRYGGDVPVTTILRELKRTGTARVTDGTVHVLRRNYRLDTVDAAALARAGSVLRDIGQTVTHNLYRGHARRALRSASDERADSGVGAARVPQIRLCGGPGVPRESRRVADGRRDSGARKPE